MWEEYFLGLGRSLGPFIPCYKTDKFVNLQKITEAIANNEYYTLKYTSINKTRIFISLLLEKL